MRKRADQSLESSIWQNVAVAVVVVVALVLVVLAFTTSNEPPPTHSGSVVASDTAGTDLASDPASASPDATPTGISSDTSGGTSTGTEAPSASPTAQPGGGDLPPDVEHQRRADFSDLTDLPGWARSYDNDAVGEPMSVDRGVLQHGDPTGPVAVSSLEGRLTGDVREVGARVRFGGQDPGQVVLVAWQSSFIDSRRSGSALPKSGLRLVVANGAWRLTVAPGDQAIATGTFTPVTGSAAISVVRDGERAWVVDPSGAATPVADPRIGQLAGPWACWQLVEETESQTPAVIESVWAG